MQKRNRLLYYLSHPLELVKRIKNNGRSQDMLLIKNAFTYDMDRYRRYAGVINPDQKENLIARIIHTYHGIEKGLTMPNRRLNFGRDAVLSLVDLISQYKDKYGQPESQVAHGIGVLKAYTVMHKDFDDKEKDVFWNNIHSLIDQYPDIEPAIQPHMSRDEFYANVFSDFEKFAKSRHTLRHYFGPVSEAEIETAVSLALTAPSACNRQPVRVHCISDKNMKNEVLAMQSGNRGFGDDADKVLIVTGDLSDICWIDERYDIYTNCGIFLMNLCYSLFFHKIAHCVLNWSICVNPEKDANLHKLAKIPDNEVIVAMISCGKTPDIIDVAQSPKKEVSDILSFH